MSDELTSPPYPGEACTVDLLYKHLGDLREWVLDLRDGLNAIAGQEIIPAVKPIGKKPAYAAQPVLQHFQHLMFMRKVREEWDHVVRLYEDDWDDKHCIRARLMLVQAAAVQLNEAFVPQEVREARAQQHMERVQQAFTNLGAMFSKMMEPSSDKKEEESDG